jgi:asparagine synthase (glutamine-hydrolysing)
MCGIAAIFSYSPDAPPVDRAELLAMRDHMTARGPDGAGLWISPDQRIGLAHRRLSIIDLSEAGAQPMFACGVRSAEPGAFSSCNQEPLTDNGLGITFNGEIYNYQALRSSLQALGYKFRSNCDTEVLLHLYAEKGADLVHDLRGMYAFALWDARTRSLLLARDPFGIKPLYYADDGRTIRVASQVKALLQSRSVETAPEPAGHVGFFLWGNVPDPYTLYKGIRAVPAGHTLLTDALGCRQPRKFCSIPCILQDAEAAAGSLGEVPSAEVLRSALDDTVEHHLVADVPLGVFLSSGLDSATITAFAAQKHGNVRTVTLGFDRYRGTSNDEVPLAETIARQLGTEHRSIWISRHDFEVERERLFGAMDQPSTDGVNTYFVSLAARRAGLTVALSGVGGDELCGGYPSFRQIPNLVRTVGALPIPRRASCALRAVSAPVLKRFTSPKYAGLLEYGADFGSAYLLRRGMFMPWELPDVLEPELVQSGWEKLRPDLYFSETHSLIRSAHARVVALELSGYMRNQLLRDSDWAGMAHSLEIRVPLVDIDLFRRLAPLLVSNIRLTKKDLGQSSRLPLPEPLLHRRKTGFSVPVREWLLESNTSTDTAVAARSTEERGLRAWARLVYSREFNRPPCSRLRVAGSVFHGVTLPSRSLASRSKLNLIVLVSDAFGGFGGIAKFNRDLLTALSTHPEIGEITTLPRLALEKPGQLPAKVDFRLDGLGGKRRYVSAVLRTAFELRRTARKPAAILCGHINLLPAAVAAQRVCGGTLHLFMHGIEVWQPIGKLSGRICVRGLDGFIAVSELTKRRFLNWAGVQPERGRILPNCIDLSRFRPGARNPELLERYRLRGKTVLMTLGRLASEERYKGFDEVLDSMPRLLSKLPSLAYLIAGDGADRARLEAKASSLGISEFVVFAGRVREEEKVDHYRLADAYVMPSRGEGFGIVLLEAMACGIPVVASKIDGGAEALRGGALGTLVDPGNAQELEDAILRALARPRREVPVGLEYFSFGSFEARCHSLVDSVINGRRADEVHVT